MATGLLYYYAISLGEWKSSLLSFTKDEKHVSWMSNVERDE